MPVSRIQILFLSIVTFIFIISCNDNQPIPEEEFKKAYVDLVIIQDTTTIKDYSIDSVSSLVFQKHGITEDQYNQTIKFYNSQPEKWIKFFDSVTVYVERLKKEAETQP